MRALWLTLCGLAYLGQLHAASTITATNKLAYGANIGWVDWRGDTNNGAIIGEYVCFGHIYAANVGWINLGNGAPANGIQYQNLPGTDFGVNQDGQGNLRGYAYGANIGWINFENAGAAKVDLATGRFTGYAYSANCGWISLSNSVAVVQTGVIAPGADLNADGVPDAWEYLNFGATNVNLTADADADGMSNLAEYLAGTNPNSSASRLVITSQSFTNDGTAATLTWQSVPTRLYTIEKISGLSTNAWADSGLGLISPDGASTSRSFLETGGLSRFYRVRAIRPLAP